MIETEATDTPLLALIREAVRRIATGERDVSVHEWIDGLHLEVTIRADGRTPGEVFPIANFPS